MEDKKIKPSSPIFWSLMRGSISSIFGFLFGLYGLFALIRDDFLSPDIAEKLRLGGIFATIEWYWSVIIGLLLLWIGTAWEATKRLTRKPEENKSDNTTTRAENSSQAVTVKDSPNASVTLSSPAEKISPPNIVIGFRNRGGILSRKLSIHLEALPKEPDIEALIRQKRIELLKKKDDFVALEKSPEKPQFHAYQMISAMISQSLDNYEERVEKYLLVDYKNHIFDSYIYPLIPQRYVELIVEVENQSSSPASLVDVKFIIPDDFPFPTKNINHLKQLREFGIEEFPDTAPKEPEVFDYPTISIGLPYLTKDDDSSQRDTIDIGDLNIEEERENDYVVKYRVDDIVAHASKKLVHIGIWLGDVRQSKTWRIPTKVFAKELSQPLEDYFEIEVAIND